jgi:uncharacterized protein
MPSISFRSARIPFCSSIALVALLGGSALAQNATPAPAPAPQTQAAPPPTIPSLPAIPSVPQQPEPSADQIAAARAVVISSGMSRSFEPMEPELEAQIVPLMTRTRPELVADLKDVLTQLHPEFLKDADEMIDIASHIYAQQMSERDLKAAADFFNSPAGKEYVRVQPVMLDQLVVQMQSWTQKLSNTMMLRVRQEMIKKGHPNF